MKTLLNAKHWVLFLILFAIPAFLTIFASALLVAMSSPYVILIALLFSYLLSVGGIFAWFWAVGVGLNDKVPAGINVNVKNFKFFYFIAYATVLLVTFLVCSVLTVDYETLAPDSGVFSGPIQIILITILIYTLSIISCMFLIAKTIKSIELQSTTKFSDFAGEFVLMLLLPVGIWILQPRINRIVGTNETEASE